MKKQNFFIIFTALILLISITCTSCLSKEDRIRREYENTEVQEMKLAIWSPPNADKYRTEEELNQICQGFVDMGINYIYNEQEWGEETLNRLMDCYEKYGLKSIIGLPINEEDRAMRIVRATMNHPACWGFNIKDEPATEEFNHLKYMTELIRATIPEDKKITTNMLPNTTFTWDGYENVSFEAYEDYLRDYMIITDVEMLSFDHYPLVSETKIDDIEMVFYLKNLLEFNIQCREADTEATSIIQSAKWDGCRMPSATELQFLVNLNLVSGMDGITYFIYWTNVDHRGRTIIQGLMNHNGTPSPLYYTAQQINRGLSKMKGVFLNYDQVGYIFTNAPEAYWGFENDVTSDKVVFDSFGPVKSVESDASVLSGCFTKEDGSQALYVMNFNMTAGVKQKVTLNFSDDTDYKLWNHTGLADMDSSEQLILELSPGEAAFVEFE